MLTPLTKEAWTADPNVSYSYFIGGDTGPIKVGKANDPFKRLAGIQTGNPMQLYIFAIVREREWDLHSILSAHRVRGEWFERGAALALADRCTQELGLPPGAQSKPITSSRLRTAVREPDPEPQYWGFGLKHIAFGRYNYCQWVDYELVLEKPKWTQEQIIADTDFLLKKTDVTDAYSRELLLEIMSHPCVTRVELNPEGMDFKMRESGLMSLETALELARLARDIEIFGRRNDIDVDIDGEPSRSRLSYSMTGVTDPQLCLAYLLAS